MNNTTFLLTRRDLVKGAACAAVGGAFGGCVTPTGGAPTPERQGTTGSDMIATVNCHSSGS